MQAALLKARSDSPRERRSSSRPLTPLHNFPKSVNGAVRCAGIRKSVSTRAHYLATHDDCHVCRTRSRPSTFFLLVICYKKGQKKILWDRKESQARRMSNMLKGDFLPGLQVEDEPYSPRLL